MGAKNSDIKNLKTADKYFRKAQELGAFLFTPTHYFAAYLK